MEIIGVFMGKQYVIDVLPTTTFEDFGRKVLAQALPGAEQLPEFKVKMPQREVVGFLPLPLKVLITKVPVFTSDKPPRIYVEPIERQDDRNMAKLQAFLRTCASEIGPKEVTFVAVGCFDHNHGRESVLGQQCPPKLLACCLERRIDLNIVLIDPEFADPLSDKGQACTLGGWVRTLQEDDGKVRQYMNQTALANRCCDMWMTIFGLAVPEYQTFHTTKVVGGVNLAEAFAGVSAHAECALICGNFYCEGDPQYFTRGDEELLRAAGIPPRA